jgi:hypothetical protein
MIYYLKSIKFFLFAFIFLGATAEIFAVQNGKIAFTSRRTGNDEIYTMSPDGSNQTNISNNPANDFSPMWSFDGGKIAFARQTVGDSITIDVYTMNADGSNQVRLTSDGNSRNPSWSPDGTKIVFAKGFGIYLMNADGTNPIRLPTINYNDGPRFSPDGSRIAYLCSRPFDGIPPGLNDEICVINADGSNERILTKHPAAELGAVWSPDGTKIAFTTNRTGKQEVYVMNADGSNQVNLSNNPAGGSNPTWSPDGTKIAFSSNRNNNSGIYLMNADGTNQTFLIADAGSPAWQRIASPDVQFDFDDDRRADISVFRPSNGVWYRINSSNNSFSAIQFGLGTDRIAPADYDGDRKTDIAVFRQTQMSPYLSYFFILNSSNGTFRAEQFGEEGDSPFPGDWDGDGKADVAVHTSLIGIPEIPLPSIFSYRPSSNPNANKVTIEVNPGGIPVPSDYDGDGKQDAAVFRPSNGTWIIRQSSNNTLRTVQFGLSSDKPVPADYDGDGKTDIAVFRSGIWYILNSSTDRFYGVHFGFATDKPIPADYDGDNRADIAVFRDGTWFLMRSTAGFTAVQFGLSTDIPIPNAYVR